MSQVFISYARSTEAQAKQIAEALRALGYDVWRDDQIPAHEAFGRFIEERLAAARVVLVLWSADAAQSEWVRSEASRARAMGKLVQLTLDKSSLPMPFDQIQFADLSGWSGEDAHPGWRKVAASVAELVGPASGGLSDRPSEKTAAPALPDRPSIAVLPFTDMTGARDQDYFADGMVEEIVTALSRFPTLFVIAAGSSLSYRDTSRTLPQIAHELGVRYLVEGSVRKAGERVRITVKVTDASAATPTPLWTERFDGTLEDVFELQDSVANAVAAQVAPTVEAAELRRADARPTADLSAYDLYLRARHLFQAWDREPVLAAIDLLNQAVERDPHYALAWGLCSYLHSLLAINIWSDDIARSYRLAREAGDHALAADGNDAEVLAWVAAGRVQSDVDPGMMDSLLERSIRLNPGLSLAWWGSGWGKLYGGDPTLAAERLETSLRIDPKSGFRPTTVAGLGFAAFMNHRFEDAARLLSEAAESRPSIQWWTLSTAAAAHAHLGRTAEARQILGRMPPVSAERNQALLGLFHDPDNRELLRTGLILAGADV